MNKENNQWITAKEVAELANKNIMEPLKGGVKVEISSLRMDAGVFGAITNLLNDVVFKQHLLF